jgi:protein regulator of cytokinesis 1
MTMMEPEHSFNKDEGSPPAVSFMLASPPPSSGSLKIKTPNSLNDNHRSRLSAFTPVQPVLTPGARTPRGSQGHVLLSPSRTITESLQALASSTAKQLEEVWDEVGYNPQERASQLSDLLVKFRDLCEEKISEEQGVAETFRQTISDSKEEVQATSAALKSLVDPQLLRDNSGQTLTDELSSLEIALEGLRAAAAAAKEDLKECQEFLVESHEALGQEFAEKFRDIVSDLTAARREEFHRKAEEMKEETTTRTAAVIQLLRDCQHLMNDLGIDGQKSGSSLDRRIAGSLVRSKDSSFIMASKFRTDSCTGISSKSLEDLTNQVAELSGEKRRRKTRLQEMGADIAMLWEQLRIPEEEQRAFTESVKGLGMDTIDKGEAELERLKSLKSEMLVNLVVEARETIRALWEETNATQAMQRSFLPITVEDEEEFDDELLDKHDDYIRVLQNRLDQMKPIMRIIERREEILQERVAYEELQKDSDRLKQRGAAMARQLMEEEKMARRIKRELPKLTNLLKEKLLEWKESSGEDFQYRGDVYVEVMKRQGDEWAEYKEATMQLKLKKKQEEHELEENKFRGNNFHKKKNASRPLGDSQQDNTRSSSRSRPRDGISKPTRTSGGEKQNGRIAS